MHAILLVILTDHVATPTCSRTSDVLRTFTGPTIWRGISKRYTRGTKAERSRRDNWTRSMPSFGWSTESRNAAGLVPCHRVGRYFRGKRRTSSKGHDWTRYLPSLFTQKGCHAAASQNQTTRGGSGASRVSDLIADTTVIALND